MSETIEHTYDLFVSYADEDKAWVEGYLFDALNNQALIITLKRRLG